MIDVAAAEPEGGLRKAFLDLPTAGAELDSNALTIVGWAVGEGEAVESVEVLAEGQVVANSAARVRAPRGRRGLRRRTPGADRAGFRLVVQGSGEGRHELAVRGVSRVASGPPSASIVLEIQRRGLLARVFGNR